MAGFSTYADLLSELAAGKRFNYEFQKASVTADGVDSWTTLWNASGYPAAGATPATTPGTAYTDAAGSMNFFDVSTDRKMLTRVSASNSISTSLLIYDRLVAVSGIALNSTGSKTVSSTTLPRYTSGLNVQAWLELTTGITGTATLSMDSYTNDSGTTGRAGSSFSLTSLANNSMYQIPLQAGDRGVQAISTLNVTAAGSAGVANVVLLYPIARIPLLADSWNEKEQILELASMPRIYDGASLALAIHNTSTSTGVLRGFIELVYG